MRSVKVEDGRQALLEAGEDVADSGTLGYYSEDFLQQQAAAKTHLRNLREDPNCVTADESQALERAIKQMQETKRQVQLQLTLELSGAAGAREVWEQRMAEWERQISSLSKDFASAKNAVTRSALHLPNSDLVSERALAESAERRSVQRSTDKLSESTARILEAQRGIAESHEIGEGVISDLAQQRETIERARDSMRTVDGELSAARRSLDRMINHAQRNRVIFIMLMFLLGTVLAFFGLTVVGLPDKYNIVLAVVVVILGVALFFLRKYLKRRQAIREALAAAERPSSRFNSAVASMRSMVTGGP